MLTDRKVHEIHILHATVMCDEQSSFFRGSPVLKATSALAAKCSICCPLIPPVIVAVLLGSMWTFHKRKKHHVLLHKAWTA